MMPDNQSTRPAPGEAITPGDWTRALRTMRIGVRRGVRPATIRDVALTLASYADYESGARIFPGIAKLAVHAEVDYRTARTVMAILRDDLRLIQKVRSGRTRGDADEYRLAMPEDITDLVTILSPADVDLEVERIRAGQRRPRPAVRVSPDPVPVAPPDAVQVSPDPVQPVDNPPVQVSPDPVHLAGQEIRTGVAGTANDGRTGVAGTAVRVSLCPPNESLPRHNYYRTKPTDLRPAVTPTRARPSSNKPEIFSDKPQSASGRCTRHPAMRAARCGPCRAQQPPPTSPLLHLMTEGAA